MALLTNPTTYNTYCKKLPAWLVSIIPDWLYLDLETYTNQSGWAAYQLDLRREINSWTQEKGSKFNYCYKSYFILFILFQ